MKIIFYNDAHTGDGFFFKSFITQFCKLNKTIDIYFMLRYNNFLFSDIENLKLIIPNNNSNYTNNNFNFNGNYDPIHSIDINNTTYINLYNIFNKEFPNKNYLFLNDILYIKIWIGDCTPNWNTKDIECDLCNINVYYNSIINNINNYHNLKLQLIDDCNFLPMIPDTNINYFLLFKKNNKKIIFYYNYYCNSGCSWNVNENFNHDKNILKLSNLFIDYYICCALKPNVSNINIISIEDFGYIKDTTCENIAKAYYCAINSDIVYSFDTGACFYYLNNNFNNYFKGIWYHASNDKYYFDKINKYLNNSNVKFIDYI